MYGLNITCLHPARPEYSFRIKIDVYDVIIQSTFIFEECMCLPT